MPRSESRDKRRRFRWLVIVIGLAGILAVAVAVLRTNHLSPYIRSWIVATLRERYQSDVEIKELDVLSVFPEVRVEGAGLVLRHRGRKDVPPVILLRKFYASGSLMGFLRSPRRFRKLELDGLVINITPREHPLSQQAPPKKKKLKHIYPFAIAKVVANNTTLNIFPKQPDRPPHVYDISEITLGSAGLGKAMSFGAALRNPMPPGLIHTAGKFGPWSADDPGRTPVSGRYLFRHADLSVFRGLQGTLSSQGKFEGELDRIGVQGETDTPDFALKAAGNAVDLRTEFNAIVDGTNGDTLLQPVTAQFLKTTLVCRGGVVGKNGVRGKTVSLDVTTSGARVEDLIRISAKGRRPPLTGAVSLHAEFVLPPGNQDIQKKLRLEGHLQLRDARFTSREVDQKIAALSRRAQGVKKAPESATHVAADFQGRFRMAEGIMTFPTLAFSVPGALIGLHGSYGLSSEQLDFQGNLRLQAKASQMTTGIKSILLKAVDPLFEKDGAGTVLPLEITGTREHPSFKVDIRRAIFRR